VGIGVGHLHPVIALIMMMMVDWRISNTVGESNDHEYDEGNDGV
jgi:hypothetical protein